MKAWIIAASTMLATPAHAIPVFGVSLETCGRWTAEKTDKADRLVQMGWLGGFLSGYNLSAQANKTGSVDVYAALAWVDERCEAKPLQNVATTALELIMELNRK